MHNIFTFLNLGSFSLQIITEQKIINNIIKLFRESININSKVVLKQSILNNSKYSNFSVDAYDINLYLIEIEPGNPKYFINKDDAFNYLIKNLNLKNNSYQLDTNKYDILTINKDDQLIYFNSYNEFLYWFKNNLIIKEEDT